MEIPRVRHRALLAWGSTKYSTDTTEEQARFRSNPDELKNLRHKLIHVQNTFYSAVSWVAGQVQFEDEKH